MTAPLFTGGNHICVVTRDLDRAVRAWADRYGVGPWYVYAYGEAAITADIDGEPAAFGIRVGLCRLSAVFRLEIIEPLDERSPYARSLSEHGGADHLHHVRFDVPDFDEASERLDRLGVPRVLDARFSGGDASAPPAHARYFDASDDLGLLVEIAGMHESFQLPEPEYVYPPGP